MIIECSSCNQSALSISCIDSNDLQWLLVLDHRKYRMPVKILYIDQHFLILKSLNVMGLKQKTGRADFSFKVCMSFTMYLLFVI